MCPELLWPAAHPQMLGSGVHVVKKWKMKKRHKITELIIKESAEIDSVISNGDGTFSLINSDGKKVAHAQYDGVGYLRDSGKPKFLRSITRGSKYLVGDNPWKNMTQLGLLTQII